MKKFILLFLLFFSPCFSVISSARGTYGHEVAVVEKIDAIGLYLIRVQGFFPGEQVTCSSLSIHDYQESLIKVPDSGVIEFGHFPSVTGYNAGTCLLKFSNAGGQSVSIEFPWTAPF